jgi:hypothetical protein
MQTPEKTVSKRLEVHGIKHQPGDNGRRYISSLYGPLGLMSAEEACNLLDMLEALNPTG